MVLMAQTPIQFSINWPNLFLCVVITINSNWISDTHVDKCFWRLDTGVFIENELQWMNIKTDANFHKVLKYIPTHFIHEFIAHIPHSILSLLPHVMYLEDKRGFFENKWNKNLSNRWFTMLNLLYHKYNSNLYQLIVAWTLFPNV